MYSGYSKIKDIKHRKKSILAEIKNLEEAVKAVNEIKLEPAQEEGEK